VRITLTAAISHSDVEHSVGTEQVESAVVIRVGLIDREYQLGRRGVRDVSVRRRPVTLDPGAAMLVRIVDEHETVGAVLGMERDTQQSALPAVANLAPDVEERLLDRLSVLDHSDATRLLDDKETRIASRRSQINRVVETARDLLGREPDRGHEDVGRLLRRRVVPGSSAHDQCESEHQRRPARHDQASPSFFAR